MATDRTVFLGVNIPEALGDQVERAAKAENKTPDEFVQEAIERQLMLKRHEVLKRFGKANAIEQGLTESDLPRLIAESRTEKRER